MLANLLPGFRHTRTPLAAGSLWLLIVWLTFGGRLLPSPGGSTIERRVLRLTELVGDNVILAGLALLTVLVGSVAPRLPIAAIASRIEINRADRSNNFLLWIFGLQYDSEYARREGEFSNWLHRTASTAPTSLDWSPFSRPQCPPHMQVWVRDLTEIGAESVRINGKGVSTTEVSANPSDRGAARDWLVSVLARASIESELATELPLQLQVERESLYNEYDRVRSESDLRAAIILPLTLLIGVLATGSAFWVFAFALPVWLLRQAVQTHVEADQRLLSAVRHGAIRSSTMSFIESLRGRSTVASALETEPEDR